MEVSRSDVPQWCPSFNFWQLANRPRRSNTKISKNYQKCLLAVEQSNDVHVHCPYKNSWCLWKWKWVPYKPCWIALTCDSSWPSNIYHTLSHLSISVKQALVSISCFFLKKPALRFRFEICKLITENTPDNVAGVVTVIICSWFLTWKCQDNIGEKTRFVLQAWINELLQSIFAHLIYDNTYLFTERNLSHPLIMLPYNWVSSR